MADPAPPQPAQAAPAPKPEPKIKRPTGAKSPESVWGLRKPLPRNWRLIFSLILPVLLMTVWVVLTAGEPKPAAGPDGVVPPYHPAMIDPSFLPSPVAVLKALLASMFDGTLFPSIWASMLRIAISFALAAAVALPLGILMGAWEPINRLFEPIMAPLRYLPISAFIPLLILWFGINEAQKIAFLFLGVFVFLLPVVVTAIRAVPEELVQTALTLGATRFQVVRTVLIPHALPDIFDSFRVMNAISWTYVILAEFVNAQSGLGYMIQQAGNRVKTAQMFSGILVIGVIGLLTDALIRGFNGLVFRWREEL